MPRILNIDHRVPAARGVIIRRHTVAEQTRAYTTVQEARAYARRIVKEAQMQAQSIEQHAMQEGFKAGWRDSLDVVVQSLRSADQLYLDIEQALKKSVHEELEKVLQKPILDLLEGWLTTSPRSVGAVHIVLPRHAQSQAAAIIRRLEESLGINPSVAIGESDHVVIECGDQVFEFSPTAALQELDLLAQHCMKRLEVKKQCNTWSANTVRNWLCDLDNRHGSDDSEFITNSDAIDRSGMPR